MRKLNAPGDSVQDVFSTCIESYRDAALKNRLRSIVPVLSDEASRFEDCVLTSKTHTIPTADNVGGVVSKAEMLDIYESKFVKGTGRHITINICRSPRMENVHSVGLAL